MPPKYEQTPVYDEASFEALQDVSDVAPAIRSAAQCLPACDASETLVFARQLETISNRLYAKKYEELKGRRFVPFSSEAGEDVETLTFRVYDEVGLAVLVCCLMAGCFLACVHALAGLDQSTCPCPLPPPLATLVYDACSSPSCRWWCACVG